MVGARDALNEAKWAGGGLVGLVVWYVHRGAPGGARSVRGEDVSALQHSFMQLSEGTLIPYHRVLRIERDGAVVWQRRGPR